MVQVPAATSVTSRPLTVQIAVVDEVNETVKPELEDGESVIAVSPNVALEG